MKEKATDAEQRLADKVEIAIRLEMMNWRATLCVNLYHLEGNGTIKLKKNLKKS
jgi:hypothetical protein